MTKKEPKTEWFPKKWEKSSSQDCSIEIIDILESTKDDPLFLNYYNYDTYKSLPPLGRKTQGTYIETELLKKLCGSNCDQQEFRKDNWLLKKKYNEFIKFIKKEVDSGSFFKGLDKKNGSEFDLICLLGHRLYIIEPDANRADQVAKKYFSRMALLYKQNNIYNEIHYISYCYKGHKRNNTNEVKVYFELCRALSDLLSDKREDSYPSVYFYGWYPD